MATMEQPWPFGMSPARPPGCTANPPDNHSVFSVKAAPLSPPCLQLCNPGSETAVFLQRLTQHDETISDPPNSEFGQEPLVATSDLERMFSEYSVRSDGWITSGTCLNYLNSTSLHEDTGSDSYANRQLIEAEISLFRGFAEARNGDRKHKNSSLTLLSQNLQDTESQEGWNWRGYDREDGLLGPERTEIGVDIFPVLLHIQQCRESRNSLISNCLYLYVCVNGLEVNKAVGNHLVPMFVECGDVQSACQMFRKLINPNEHSWSFLVLGYAMNGNLHNALNLYHEMKKSNVQPSTFTFVSLLKACGSAENLQVGQYFHEQLNQRGFARDIVVGNSLVDMYIKCGSLGRAEEVFAGLPVQDVISWTALLTGYVQLDLGEDALKLYHKMQSEGISANPVTFALAAKACKLLTAIDEGQIIHMAAVQRGYENDLIVCNSLLSLYADCGFLDEAYEVFASLRCRDVVSWNTLIAAYVEHGQFQESLKCLVQMQAEKVFPDSTTLSCALKACSNLGAVDEGQKVHITTVHLGLVEDLSVSNSLVGFYSRSGLLSEARHVFDKLAQHDVVSWTALISGYAEHSHGKEALDCFSRMQKSGIPPNAVTYSCALKACACISADAEGRELHLEVTKWGFDVNSMIVNTLVSMYAACGHLLEASDVFERISAKCVVSWTAVIGAHADWGSHGTALELFEQMQAGGVSPNSVTYACTLKACSSIGAVGKGRDLHMQIAFDGFELDSLVGSALINMYARCGYLSEACDVFNDVSSLDVSAWSAMMKAYAINHQGTNAVRCFKNMDQQLCKPDLVTFTCLLTACSHAGLIQEGFEYFKSMRESYNLVPSREHYGCMVDLLARSGNLYEAERFVETFGPPSEDTWAALLSACKTHGEIHVGFRCFHQLVTKDPDDASNYALMTDICTTSELREDALRIESLRKHAEAKKKPASAWIEIDNKLHEFAVGNDQSDDVLAAVRKLNLHLKEEGHVPNLNEDVKLATDHCKEVALCEHAEKLAIAFGLLNTPHGTALRISKNLRMCSDCHNASKFVSRVEKREIILRDDCCMHHFKDGVCVCGDMF